MNLSRYYDLFFSLNILNNSRERSPSSEVDSRFATLDIPLISSLSQEPKSGLSTEPDEPSQHLYTFIGYFSPVWYFLPFTPKS